MSIGSQNNMQNDEGNWWTFIFKFLFLNWVFFIILLSTYANIQFIDSGEGENEAEEDEEEDEEGTKHNNSMIYLWY